MFVFGHDHTMPNTFRPSTVAQTLGVETRSVMVTTRGNPATVVDPRSVYDTRNALFQTQAQGKAAPFIERARARSLARKGYTVLPISGRISRNGETLEYVPQLPKQVSLGHDANVNPTSGRPL